MVTLEQIKEQQEKTAAMIASYEAIATAKSAYSVTVDYPELKPGEVHVGTIINADGKGYHLILLPGDAAEQTWQDAINWATMNGGELPNRFETALMFARIKSEFQNDWYWTCEQHEDDPAYAWMQSFLSGYQYCRRKSIQGRARAVRRLVI